MTDLSHFAQPGAAIAIRVTPNVRRAGVAEPGTPEAGKATEAARAALAQAMGVAKTRLTLLRGATSRDKLFRLD